MRELYAYTAGIIDGEGYIGINKQKGKNNRRPTFRIIVAVGNTNPRLILFLSEKFGGGIRVTEGRRQNEKPCFEWYITSNPALDFLESIEKYLVCKKDEVGLAIHLQKVCNKYRSQQNIPEDIITLQESLYRRLMYVKRIEW